MIIKEFRNLKRDYIELMATNDELRNAVEVLQKRLVKCEEQRTELIDFFKRRSTENAERVKTLEVENDHLRGMVEKQSNLLEEHTKKINELKAEIKLLRSNKDNNSKQNDNFREIIHNITATSSTKDDKLNQSHTRSSINSLSNSSLHFNHPSFQTDEDPKKELKSLKKKKKIRMISQTKYSNLDITVKNELLDAKKSSKKEKCIESSPISDQNSSKSEKKRKLYCPESDMAWIELDEDEN